MGLLKETNQKMRDNHGSGVKTSSSFMYHDVIFTLNQNFTIFMKAKV